MSLRSSFPALFVLLLAPAAYAVAAGGSCSAVDACDSGSVCVDGLCRVPVAGDPCDGVNKCSTTSGRTLKCSWSSPERGTRCAIVVQEGESCASTQLSKEFPSVDFVCNGDLSCSRKSDKEQKEGSICQQKAVNTGAACGEGIGRCDVFNQCLDDGSGKGTKVCTRGVKAGGACDSSAPFNACEYNHICLSNKCEPMLNEGQSCSLSSGPLCRGPPTSWGPELTCLDGTCQSPPDPRACGDAVCYGESTCVNNKCVDPEGTVPKGSPCVWNAEGSKRCKPGLECAKSDGRPPLEIAGESVCVEYVESGCDESQLKVCKGEPNARKVCQNGQCVASKIGLFRDQCGDDTGVTCYPGDECGEGALSCFDIGGQPWLSTRTKYCGAVNLGPGEKCSTGAKANPTPLRCAEGLRCYTPVLNIAGVCTKYVGEGESCNPQGSVLCQAQQQTLACAGGKCVVDPGV